MTTRTTFATDREAIEAAIKQFAGNLNCNLFKDMILDHLSRVAPGDACPECGGMGGAQEDRVSSSDMAHYTEWVNCRRCDGKGVAKPAEDVESALTVLLDHVKEDHERDAGTERCYSCGSMPGEECREDCGEHGLRNAAKVVMARLCALTASPSEPSAVEVTDAMVGAALSSFYEHGKDHEPDSYCMRAAITAALKAQGEGR